MKWLAIIGLALGLTSAPAALAGDLPSVKYEGKHPVTLRYRELTVTIDSAPGSDADNRVPVIKGRYGDREIFSLKIEDAEAREPLAAARVIWLDHAAAFPQVVLTAFTFGAHCCTVTKIATMTAPDTWHVIDGPQLDGDEGYTFADLGHDGTDELISYDNDFLYAFASYADSFVPTRVAKLAGTDITDVSSDPKYRDFLRGRVREMETQARKDPQLWHSNGFLGGWVAAKSLVGEVDEAWARMLKSFDKKSDWSMQECTTGAEIDKCPQGKLRDLTFPDALKKLMASGDYPLPKNAR
jgi:serine protease Do